MENTYYRTFEVGNEQYNYRKLFSLAFLNRTIIECYVYSYCIKHFKEEKLWESWISHDINKKLDKLPNKVEKESIKKIFGQLKSHN